MNSLSLLAFPEELLERILFQALPAAPDAARPHWLRSPNASETRLATLCVSRQLNRIATPLLYHSVHLDSPTSAHFLLRTLYNRPELACHIRCLTVGGLWSPVIEVLRLCAGITALDLTIAFEEDDEVVLDPFMGLKHIRHLTLRKPSNVYLSIARPRAYINLLARAIITWPELSTANIAFKLSDDTPTSPTTNQSTFSPFALPLHPAPSQQSSSQTQTGPISLLAYALASAPALHTFSTHLPSVWNTSIALIASNPRLERIVLSDGRAPTSTAYGVVSPAITGTGLFLMEARRHPRLAELISAGTPIIRSRAQTLGTRSPPMPSPASASAPCTDGTGKRESGIGLGLRIDTSSSGVMGGSRSRSPGAGSPGNRSAVAVNPAWMGPSRSNSGKGKARARV